MTIRQTDRQANQ